MAVRRESTQRVHTYIRETLAATVSELSSPNGYPSISLRRRNQRASSFFIDSNTRALEATETTAQITYTWPGKNVYEAWKYTVAMKVFAAIVEAVRAGIVVSKRDIYYSDPACFGSQNVVDAMLDDFAHTMGVDRAALNVDATAKGLVVGCYRQITRNQEIFDGSSSSKEVLIPRTQDIVEVDIANAEWILIIEKEAVFRRLTASNFHLNSAAGKGILITKGKGYPDLNTRAFVRALSDGCARLDKPPQFYVLVDSDPDGMAIMSTYKYGTMAHASDNARLNVPCIRWLGLRTSDVAADTDPLGDNSLIKLTTRDRKKAVSMLSNSPVWADSGPELEWRAELQQMLMLNLKAEIETLYNREGGIERWISQKMTVR